MSDDNNKIKIFGSDDNLKALGELLSNETSRKIISSLMQNEMYTNEISTKLDMRVSLVIHHLKKMEELGLLNITNKKIIKKGQEHRFFKMNSDIFITLNNTKIEVKEKGILTRIFKEGVKFASISIGGVISYFMVKQSFVTQVYKYPRTENMAEFDLLIIPLIVVIIGLLVIYFLKNKN